MRAKLAEGGGLRVASFHLHRDLILVLAKYDSDRVHSTIWIPESFKNLMPQQGIVVEVGPKQRVIQTGDRVIFHPWAPQVRLSHGVIEICGKAYTIVSLTDIAGTVSSGGELFPLPDEVVILPEFRYMRPGKKGLIYVSGELDVNEIPDRGYITKVGKNVTTVEVGDKVVFPPSVGSEIGIIDTVFYTIKEKDLLAREATPIHQRTPT